MSKRMAKRAKRTRQARRKLHEEQKSKGGFKEPGSLNTHKSLGKKSRG